jgi:putative transposase
LKLQGVKMSLVAIYKWIKKYVNLMKSYLDKITPNVSAAWRADELYLKVRGNPKYLFALMDDQTRFWVAQQAADTKYTSNIQPLFKDAKLITDKRPNTLITDGPADFHDAFKKEFLTINSPRTRHISHIRLQGDHNNNKMERMNGEVRDREKVLRGPDTTESIIIISDHMKH